MTDTYKKEKEYIKQHFDLINKGDMYNLYKGAYLANVKPCEIAYLLIKVSEKNPRINPFANIGILGTTILDGFDHDNVNIVFPENIENVTIHNIRCASISFKNPKAQFTISNITAERIILPEQADLSSNMAAGGVDADSIGDNVDATVFIPSKTTTIGNIISTTQHGLVLSLDVRHMHNLKCSRILADPEEKKEGWHMTPGNVICR